jgi:hypothetical protein
LLDVGHCSRVYQEETAMSAPEFSVNGEAFVVVPLREYGALRRLADTAAAADEAKPTP